MQLNRNMTIGLGVAAGAFAGFALARLALRTRMSWAGKVVLITGGSRGLGLTLARQLADAGARTILLARDADELDRAAEQVRGCGPEPMAIPCDITRPEQARHAVHAAVARYGRLDAIINNAGVMLVAPYEHVEPADVEHLLGVHLRGPMHVTEAALPHLRHSDTPRVVNIASIGGRVAVPHMLPYSVSKFALVGWSQALSVELHRQGVPVTTVCPSTMRTGSPPGVGVRGRHEQEYAWFAIADALPVLSVNVEWAARRILAAAQRGQPHLTLPAPARLAEAFAGAAPNTTVHLLRLVDRMLPAPADAPEGDRTRRGHESESPATRSFATALTRAAARRNNEPGVNPR